MSRFNSPEEVMEYALRVAKRDIARHRSFGYDLNPYCTQGARCDWQRGFDRKPPRQFELESTQQYDTIYQRGRAVADLLQQEKELCPEINVKASTTARYSSGIAASVEVPGI